MNPAGAFEPDSSGTIDAERQLRFLMEIIREQLIHESAFELLVDPARMDELWAKGWRHFGPMFFRYSLSADKGRLVRVRPLRLRLDEFEPSRSQRRVRRRNHDLILKVQPPAIDGVRNRLFELHRRRFTENVPRSLEDFLGPRPDCLPCTCVEMGLYLGEKLIAASYLDIGEKSVSSVYAIFDPAESRRSLGICTMLHEIRWARERGYKLYYPGYAYDEPSAYDYKKNFEGLEAYDWNGGWQKLPRLG